MADRNKTKSERRQAAGHATKAERKEAKLRRKQSSGSAGPPLEAVTSAGEGASAVEDGPGAGIEQRLARLEQAVVAQSQLSEELLEKLDEVLEEARKSARHAKTAAAGPDPAGEAADGDAPEDEAPSPPPAAP